MKKSYRFILCVIAVVASSLSFSACENKTGPETTAAADTGNAQIANPIVEYQTLEEAWEVLGFTSGTPAKLPEGYELSGIMTISKEIAQVVYKNGESMLVFRTAKGSEDISGDYNTYASEKTISVGELQVTAKGTDELRQVAFWTNGDLCYSLTFSEGVSDAQLAEMIQSVS